MADPSLLFLDEPTSGLDSTTSFDLVFALKAMAKKGANIITVLHQPSFPLYQMFTHVLLLGKGGVTVYLGPSQVTRFTGGKTLNSPQGRAKAEFFTSRVVCRESFPFVQSPSSYRNHGVAWAGRPPVYDLPWVHDAPVLEPGGFLHGRDRRQVRPRGPLLRQ